MKEEKIIKSNPPIKDTANTPPKEERKVVRKKVSKSFLKELNKRKTNTLLINYGVFE